METRWCRWKTTTLPAAAPAAVHLPKPFSAASRTATIKLVRNSVVANIYLAERMASAKHEPIMGVWGQSPQWVPGAEPLVGVRGRSPPEAEKVLRFVHAMGTANLPYKLQLSVLWKLSKPLLFVISPKLRCNRCSGVPVQSNSVYAVKNFSCWTASIWGMNRYSRQQGNTVYNFLVRCAI